MKNSDKPIKRSFALVIYNNNRSKVLILKRANTSDERFPGMWSLPSGTLQKNESYEDGINRVAKEKLGLKVKILQIIGEDEADRTDHITHLREYECEIIEPVRTQDLAYRPIWGTANDLKETAEAGSLCSGIFLKNLS